MVSEANGFSAAGKNFWAVMEIVVSITAQRLVRSSSFEAFAGSVVNCDTFSVVGG